MRLFLRLSGADIFISYSRKDGALYAAGLADKLTERNFSCFIDRYGVKPGHDLPTDLINNIRGSSVMVVVGTKMAAASEFVRAEIRIFKETGRIILPVDFGDNIGNSIWYDEIPGLASETEKALEALDNGHPSENVINFIEKSFKYTRRNQHMARMFKAAVATFVILIGLGIGGFAVAKNEANKARAEAQQEKLKAETARREANRAREDAETQNARAENEKERAEHQTRLRERAQWEAGQARHDAETATARAQSENKRANSEEERAKRQTELAANKAREVDAATRLADEQKRQKDVAERQRIEAQNSRDDARRDASALQEQANIHLAENYYNIAETESMIDPLRALPWLEKAIEIEPQTDSRFDAYKLRALHKTRFAYFSVANTGTVGFDSRLIRFSPDLNLIFFETGQANSLWDLRSGTALALPPAVAQGKLGVDRFAFSGDGDWAAAFLGEKNGNEESKEPTRDKELYIWEVRNPRNCFDIRSADFRTIGFSGLKFSSDSRFVIVDILSINRKVKLLSWEVQTGRELGSISSDLHLDEFPPKNKGRTTIRDVITARKKLYELTKLPIAKSPATNLIITFENKADATIALLRNLSSDFRVEKKIPLEKYIDFIDFTGNSERLITLSHNPAKKRILRVWDVATGTVIKEVKSFKNNVIAVSRTGNQIVTVPDDKRDLQVYSIEKAEAGPSIRAFGDNETIDYSACFTDDDQHIVVITEEWNSRLSRERDPRVNRNFLTVWDITADRYWAQRILTIDPLEDFYGLSGSNKRAAFVNDNGAVIVRPLVPAKAPLQTQIELPTGDDSYYFDLRSNDAKTFIAIRHLEDPGRKWGDCEISRWDVDFDWMHATRKWRQQVENASGFASISKDNKYFIVLRGHEVLEASKEFSIFDLSGKETPKDISIDQAKQIIDLEFDRSGSKIIGAIGERGWTVSPEIHRWDASTGKEDTLRPPLKLWSSTMHKYGFHSLGLTRYGEYLVETPPDDDAGGGRVDTFSLESTESTQGEFRSLRFRDHQEATLASQLLKQAEKITDRGDDVVVAINRDLTIEFKNAGTRFSILNEKTGRRILPPGYTFDTAKISGDGKLVVANRRGTSSVWSAETGSLITDRIREGDEDIFVDFRAAGSSVVTISSRGKINTWFLRNSDHEVPSWVRGMGSAITGMEINENLEMINVPQDKLIRIRNDYIKKLEEAAAHGDKEAKYILENLKPSER